MAEYLTLLYAFFLHEIVVSIRKGLVTLTHCNFSRFLVPVSTFLPSLDSNDDDDDEKLEAQRRRRILDARLYVKIREMFLQFLHFVLLVLICYDNRTSTFYQQNKAIKDILPLDFPNDRSVSVVKN